MATQDKPVPVRALTISREYGAGGFEVGHEISSRLGVELLDRALVEEVSRRLRCTADVVDQWDERGETMILRLLRALRSAHPEYASPAALAPDVAGSDPHPERIVTVIQEVIREAARLRRSVILGRGGAFILRDWPGVFSVRLVACREDRIRHIGERLGLSHAEATRKTDQADRERRAYIKQYYNADLADSTNFALTLNTSMLARDAIVETILRTSGMDSTEPRNGSGAGVPDREPS